MQIEKENIKVNKMSATIPEYVLKVCSPLSNQAQFIKLQNADMSIDSIINGAIESLKLSKPLESQNLEQMYKTHQLYSNNQVVQKGDLFSGLQQTIRIVGTREVHMIEISMLSSHAGGIE